MFKPTLNIDGAQLKALRKSTPYTQEALGEKLGLSRETINAIENNKKTAIKSLTIEVINNWRHACDAYADNALKSGLVNHLRSVFGI